jgi:hypothetical protein
MAELVDAPASGAGAGNGVEVRVLFRAPFSCSQTLPKACKTLGKLLKIIATWPLMFTLVRV